MQTPFRAWVPLIAILLLALTLRLIGIGWGLPNNFHVQTYHPDESTVVDIAVGNMDVLNGQLLPHYYNYGSLQFFLVNAAESTAFLFNGVDIASAKQDLAQMQPMPGHFANWDRIFLIARMLNVLMAVGTVWAVAAIGTRLWGKKAGLLAAAILAIVPLHVLQSHWATVDVPAAFWGTLAILAAVRCQAPKRTLLWALLGGAFAGLAAATKYNMALFVLPVAAAILFPPSKAPPRKEDDGQTTVAAAIPSWGKRFGYAVAAIAACAAAYLAGCPGTVLESQLFLQGLDYEAWHVSTQPGVFTDTGNGFVYLFTHTLDASLGLPLLLLTIAGLAVALLRRERGDVIMAAAALPYTILIGLAVVRYARYVMPLLPLLSLWSARAVVYASVMLPRRVRRDAYIACGIVMALTTWYTLWLVVPMSTPDPRDRAVQWLNAHPGSSATIGFPAMPWFQTAPVSPFFPLWQRSAWMKYISDSDRQRVFYQGDWDTDTLSAMRPGAVVVGENDTKDAMRLADPSAKAYLDALNAQYHLAFSAGGLKPPPGLPQGHLPDDMIYADPKIDIYVRK